MVSVKNSPLIPSFGSEPNISVWLHRTIKDKSLAERQAVVEACTLAFRIHSNQRCISGEPYIMHVLTVADILADLGMDTEVLVAAILHEVTEHKGVKIENIRKQFGENVSSLVEGVTKMNIVDTLYNKTSSDNQEEDDQSEGLRRMLLAMVEDVRVMLIKLADHLHNMRLLDFLPIEEQHKVARRTLDLFAPIANRLGIGQIKWELEDLSLRYLEPDTYQRMAKLLDERRIDRESYIQQVVNTLEAELKRAGIVAEVTGRPKHIYSIWRKMQRKGLNFHQIFDVRAVRVMVNSVNECYMTLGIVHSRWQPLRGEFDDYIANPKLNNYQSLHTTVIGPEQKIFEVQIRTYAMHHNAELGVAAHWCYKEERSDRDDNFEQKVAWLRQLPKWKEEENDAGDFIDRFKSEVFEDRVYVLSPQGKVIDLPQGSTPLDFAYAIHTELGHRCRGAKVDNRIVSLTYLLKNGDQVEILSATQERPSRDWLNPNLGYLKTSRARAKVRSWLKKQDTEQHIKAGRILLERELHRLNLKELKLEQVAQHLNFSSIEELFIALGRGDASTLQIARIFNDQIFPKKVSIPSTATGISKIKNGIYINGIGGLLSLTAGCCKPVPYDPIIGYITKNRGVVIHRRDCSNALQWQDENNERLIEVDWSQPELQTNLTYPVDIFIRAYDRKGLLRDIISIVTNEKINIIATNTITDKTDNQVKMTMTLEVGNFDQLSRVLEKIDNLPNVTEVSRKI
jgi:GTP pyrophosphokinase